MFPTNIILDSNIFMFTPPGLKEDKSIWQVEQQTSKLTHRNGTHLCLHPSAKTMCFEQTQKVNIILCIMHIKIEHF